MLKTRRTVPVAAGNGQYATESIFAAMSKTPRPLRILVVGQTPPPFGGQAVMIQKLVEGRFDRVQIHHVRLEFSKEMDEVGRFQVNKILILFKTIAAIMWGRIRYGARVLYYPPSGPNMVPVLRDIILLNAVRWMFKRTVFHFHGSGVSTFGPSVPSVLRPFFRSAYARPDLAIRVSPVAPEDGLYFHAKDNVVVHNGIEDEAGGPIDRSGRGVGPVRLLFIGVLIPSKGVQVLLESFVHMRKDGLDVEVDLMGKWGSPEFERQCMDLIAREGVADRVHFLGVRTGAEKAQALRDADIFCFPSHFEAETSPLVLMEAMEYSLPIVSTRWRGIPALVDNGANGLLVEPQDARAVADAVGKLVADPTARTSMGNAGRKAFEARFSVQQHLRAMEDAFLRLHL